MSSEVVARVKRFLEIRTDVQGYELGAHTKFAPSTVRHVLDGQRPASPEMEAELERVLRLAVAGEIFPQGGSPVVITETRAEGPQRVRRQRDFYQTETVRRIGQTLSYCAELGAIGVLTADYGVGKTEGVKAWRRGEGRKVESIVFEFDSFSSSNRVEFIEALAEQLECEFTPGHHNGGKTLRAVCRRLVEQPCLMICDQCENVRPVVMDVARQIWDRTRDAGVGMVFLGAPVLADRMLASRKRDLGAITSRVGVWAQLQGLSAAEMADILKREGIAELDEDAFRLWHRAVGGSMRRLMASIDLVRTKHVARQKAITTKTIEGVAANLWGMSIDGRAA